MTDGWLRVIAPLLGQDWPRGIILMIILRCNTDQHFSYF